MDGKLSPYDRCTQRKVLQPGSEQFSYFNERTIRRIDRYLINFNAKTSTTDKFKVEVKRSWRRSRTVWTYLEFSLPFLFFFFFNLLIISELDKIMKKNIRIKLHVYINKLPGKNPNVRFDDLRSYTLSPIVKINLTDIFLCLGDCQR